MAEGSAKRPRGRPKSVDRQRAIDVAVETWWREGLHSVSLNQLCKRAQISKPGLYREFGGEDGLMMAALAAYREQEVLPLLGAFGSELPFRDLLDAVVAGMIRERDRPPGCLFTRMRLDDGRLGEETRAAVRTLEKERRDVFEARYRRALAGDEAEPSVSPQLAATYLDTQFTTLLVQMAAGEPRSLVREQARLALSVLLARQG